MKHLDFSFAEVQNEVVTAFEDRIGEIGDGKSIKPFGLRLGLEIVSDWASIRLLPLAQYVVSRSSNRVYVGPELCPYCSSSSSLFFVTFTSRPGARIH